MNAARYSTLNYSHFIVYSFLADFICQYSNAFGTVHCNDLHEGAPIGDGDLVTRVEGESETAPHYGTGYLSLPCFVWCLRSTNCYISGDGLLVQLSLKTMTPSRK